MRFSLCSLALLSASIVSGAAVPLTKRDAGPIIDAVHAISKAIQHQDEVISRFPDTATFAEFDEAGDALTARLNDLSETIKSSPKLASADSNSVIDALVRLVPNIKTGLKLVVAKKAAIVAKQMNGAQHVHEELGEDQDHIKEIARALHEKLTVHNPMKLINIATQLNAVFQGALSTYG